MQYHAIQCNTMQYHAIPCNTIPCMLDKCWRSVPLPCGQNVAIFILVVPITPPNIVRLPPVTTSTTPRHTHHGHNPNNPPHSNIKTQSQILTMSWNPFQPLTISNMAQLGIPGKPYFLLWNILQTKFHQKYMVSLVGFPNWHVSRSKWVGEADYISSPTIVVEALLEKKSTVFVSTFHLCQDSGLRRVQPSRKPIANSDVKVTNSFVRFWVLGIGFWFWWSRWWWWWWLTWRSAQGSFPGQLPPPPFTPSHS